MQFQKVNRTAYVNFLRSKREMWAGEVLVRSYPYYLIVDPTSICQLRCPTCPTGVENESRKARQRVVFRDRTKLDMDLFEALLHELGDYLFLIIFYNWGEPLLNRKLPEYIRKAKAHNIAVEIHSNLSLRLSDSYIEDLLCSGIDTIGASIDGFSQESYQIYRRGGNFDLAKGNLERLVAKRDTLGLNTDIIWNFLVFSFTEHEIGLARKYCEEIGIIFNRREAFISNPDWLPSYRKNEVDALLKGPKQWDIPSATTVEDAQVMSPCAWHYGYSVVNANGMVSPCCAPWKQEHDFGTLAPGLVSFADVWNNNLFRKSRGAFANKDVKGLEKVDTLCLQCPFDRNVQNLYSGFDLKVIEQLRRISAGADPLLSKGFELLSEPGKFLDFFRSHGLEWYSDALAPIPLEPNEKPDALPPQPAVPDLTYSRHIYESVKSKTRPLYFKLFQKYPSLYYLGKKLENRWIRRQ